MTARQPTDANKALLQGRSSARASNSRPRGKRCAAVRHPQSLGRSMLHYKVGFRHPQRALLAGIWLKGSVVGTGMGDTAEMFRRCMSHTEPVQL